MANFTITIPDSLIAQLPAGITQAKIRAFILARLRAEALEAFSETEQGKAKALIDAKRAALQLEV